jgi:hypothetical protein
MITMTSQRLMSWIATLSALAALTSVFVALEAESQAYCSLRDPVESLQRSFANFDHYRSVVRRVGPEHREEIRQVLPFTIHQNELGTHTLYVAYDQENRPLGFIHVRTERGRWGLNEIAWVLDADLRVRGMQFQRSRDQNRDYVESEAFQEQIRGLGFAELRALLNDDGTEFAVGTIDVPEDARPLAETILRSALKTVSVTKLVWSDTLPSDSFTQGSTISTQSHEEHGPSNVPAEGVEKAP